MTCVGERFYHCKATGLHAVICKTKPILCFISRHFMLDIVSNGDNLQEKSNLYFWEEYEKCFAVFRISMYPSQC